MKEHAWRGGDWRKLGGIDVSKFITINLFLQSNVLYRNTANRDLFKEVVQVASFQQSFRSGQSQILEVVCEAKELDMRKKVKI